MDTDNYTPWDALEIELSMTKTCKGLNHEKRYLILIFTSFKKLYEAELSYTELFNIIQGPYNNLIREKGKEIKLEKLHFTPETIKNPSTNSTCITHAAFCFARSYCFIPTKDPLLLALSHLNHERKDAFNDILVGTKNKSVYYNAGMSKELFNTYYYSYEMENRMMLMLIGIYTYMDDLDILDNKKFYDTKSTGHKVIKKIDWASAAAKTNLTSPVYICNYNSDCNLFSLAELYYKEFPRIVSETKQHRFDWPTSIGQRAFSSRRYNSLHSMYAPQQCYGEKSCKPIYGYISETGRAIVAASNSSFSNSSGKPFSDELLMLHDQFPRREKGFHIDILEYYANKTHRDITDYSEYGGLHTKLISKTLKDDIAENIGCYMPHMSDPILFGKCLFNASAWNQFHKLFDKPVRAKPLKLNKLIEDLQSKNRTIVTLKDPEYKYFIRLLNPMKIEVPNKTADRNDTINGKPDVQSAGCSEFAFIFLVFLVFGVSLMYYATESMSSLDANKPIN